MKLMMFETGRGAALGLVEGKSVIDLSAADPALPADLKSLIAVGPAALAAVKGLPPGLAVTEGIRQALKSLSKV